MKKLFVVLSILISSTVSAFDKKEEVKLDKNLVPHSDQSHNLDEVSVEELKQLIISKNLDMLKLLTPEQRRTIRELELAKEEALKKQAPLKNITNIINVELEPGSLTKSVYTSPGQNSYLNIIDSMGNPWPITHVFSGDKNDFPVTKVETEANNTVQLNSNTRVGSTNLTVFLEGLSVPININAEASKEQYHGYAPIRISGLGPNSPEETQTIESFKPFKNISKFENVILSRKPSLNAKRLQASDPRVQAWLDGEDLFIRTNLVLRHPRPTNIYNGTFNFKAYKTFFLPSMALTDSLGNEVSVKLNKDL